MLGALQPFMYAKFAILHETIILAKKYQLI